MEEVLYRIEGYLTSMYSGYEDYNNDSLITYPKLELRIYDVIKHIPKGKWINVYNHNKKKEVKRWVSNEGNKRYAYPTELEAYKSFIKRKKAQSKIMQKAIKDNHRFIKMAEKFINDAIEEKK